MPNHSPPLTVLMAVYNGMPYIDVAIESILAQSFDNFEFLIVDDGSMDTSKDVIQSYKDPRIRLIENKSNVGLTRSLNRGLRLAQGKYIARLDQDDIALEHRLERQISYMEQHSNVVLLGTWCQSIDELGNKISNFCPPTSHQEIVDAFATYNPFAHSSIMFRREPILELGGYPEDFSYSQDNALWLQLSCKYQVANLPEELVRIRQHSCQTGISVNMKMVISWEAVHIYQKALSHPSMSTQARKTGQRTVASAKLDYSLALWQEGRYKEALSWAGSVCIRYPFLSVKHLCFTMLYMLLGTRRREIVRVVRKNLRKIFHNWGLDNQ